jgi:hypothetical protein
MSGELRDCPMCMGPVREGAYKCPHCHTRQYRTSIHLVDRSDVILFGVIFLAIVTSALIRRGDRDEAAFTDHPGALEISGIELSNPGEDSSREIIALGRIKNVSEIPWKDLYFEAQFFNRAGALIDTVSNHDYQLFVPAHGESTFKITLRSSRPKDEYANCKIFIRQARDGRSRI